MSKPFDYSKWDNIEISDDEDDVHPNIDKESWFRMKHRSRVEREENEEKDKDNIKADMEKASLRIKILQHDIEKLKKQQAEDSDSDEDIDDIEGLETELNELKVKNEERQTKLDQYEKDRKWNVDNMFEVKEERTLVNSNAGKETYTETGFAVERDSPSKTNKTSKASKPTATATASSTSAKTAAAVTGKDQGTTSTTASTPVSRKPDATDVSSLPPVEGPTPAEVGAMETYHEFTERHADTVEAFMACKTLEESRVFLLKHGNILLQENASNYLLLASLEDEMNGLRDKMKVTARQSQLISSIAELAKTVRTHPGNVIQPFFQRLQERVHLEEFLSGVNVFVEKIIKRAVVKKKEIDSQREGEEAKEAKELNEIPREERLGPGGLDPLEVIETLPTALVEAFETRDVDQLREALVQLDPDDAEYHMKRCIDSGLWVANS